MAYSTYIPGSHDPFPHRLFEQVARECDDLDIIVQCGVGFGYGPCYMMEALAAAAKRPHHYAFDTFGFGPPDEDPLPTETPWGESMVAWLARSGGRSALLDHFLHHVNTHPCRTDRWEWAQFPSWTICDNFVDESVAFVFLNASRSEQNVGRELRGWWRAIKPGGTLAVYGANQSGVDAACTRFLLAQADVHHRMIEYGVYAITKEIIAS